MSDAKPHDDEPSEDAAAPTDRASDGAGADAPAAPETRGADRNDDDEVEDPDEDDDLDLADLDALGVEGVVAGLRAADDDEPPSRRGRSPLISLVVLAFSVYLLVTMFGDFRFWLRSGEPEDLGAASEWIADGRIPEGFHNHYVVLEGTPDVQNAAVLTTKGAGPLSCSAESEQKQFSYLRVTEGGGGLFAAVPRSDDRERKLEFEGRYQGRIVTLGGDRAYTWLDQFYAQNDITRTVDSDPDALLAALANRAGEGLELSTQAGVEMLAGRDRVSLVVGRPEVRVQLGAHSFDAQAAQAAVEGLGYPFVAVDAPSTFRQFVVRIPPAERDAARRKLEGLLQEEPNPADPREGVAVLPMTATFTVAVRDLEAVGNVLSFPVGDNAASPGFDVVDGTLVERDLAGAPMQIPSTELSAVRVDVPIELDAGGYLIEVGTTPADLRSIGLLWLVALGIALANVGALAVAYRHRRA